MDQRSAVGALGALAQETRLAVFRMLVGAGPAGLAAGVIAERLNVPPATLSFHLAQLSKAGLVTSVRFSRSIVYAADFEAMQALVGFLTDQCCGGNPNLCAPVCTPQLSAPRGRKGRVPASVRPRMHRQTPEGNR